MTINVLIAGINGATANTVVVGTTLGVDRELTGGSILASLDPEQLTQFPSIEEIRFAGWDIGDGGDALDVAKKYDILPSSVLGRADAVPVNVYRPAVTAHDVEELAGALPILEAQDQVQGVRDNIKQFATASNSPSKSIVVYLAAPGKVVDQDVLDWNEGDFEVAIKSNDPRITSGMIYCYSALSEGCGFIDFTPTATLEIRALRDMAERLRLPIAGRDGSTGQTLLKSVIGEMMRNRSLKVDGWYSTNIIGNNDGLVLSRRDHAEIKTADKMDVLIPVLGYDDFDHVVDIRYYRPRGDNKESWDAVDFSGWHNQKMSFRIDWMGRDSILAAPLVLDLVRLVYRSMELERGGFQAHLDIYFKRPLGKGWRPFSHMYNDLKEQVKADSMN
jgi:myo-inositol-1-phosphate synthase